MKRVVLMSLLVMLLVNLALAGDNVWTFCGPDPHMAVVSIAVDPVHPETVYIGGGSDDGPDAYRSTDGGTRWEPIMEAPPSRGAFPVAVDPLTSGTLYIGTGAYGADYLAKSTDYGESWNPADSGLVSSVKCLAINPINTEILYAGVYYARVFKSIDGGKSWEFKGWGIDNPWVFSIALDPFHPNTLYIGCAGLEGYYGAIYKSTDGAENWELAMEGIPWRVEIGHLAIDPRDPNTIYAGVGEMDPLDDAVYKTVDGAKNWVKADSGLQSEVGCTPYVAVDPLHPYIIYAGTRREGIFKSVDGAQSWQDFSEGLPENIEIVTLTVAPTTPVKIYAGTWNRGVWCYTDTLSGVEDTPSPNLPTRPYLSQNYPNPFNSITAIGYQLSGVSGRPMAVTLKVYNLLGKRVKTLVDTQKEAGIYLVCWDGTDDGSKSVASGIYFYRIEVGEYSQTRKMVILR